MPDTPTDPRPVGLVLAGGRARRMGGGLKALLPFRGAPMLAHALDALRPHCSRLVISANQLEPFAPFGLPVVPDATPGCGPLGGILAGMVAAEGAPLLVLACDLPLIRAADLAPLVAAGRPDRAVVYGHARGREPLAAWYGPGVRPGVEAMLADGAFKVLDLFDRVNTTVLPWEREIELFTNVNEPGDLARIEALSERRIPGERSRG
jgi:molybdenum cofactor guanylyltransferase